MRTPIESRPLSVPEAPVILAGLAERVFLPLALGGLGAAERLAFLGFHSAARLLKLLIGVLRAVVAGVAGADAVACFLLVLIAVSCMISRSSFH